MYTSRKKVRMVVLGAVAVALAGLLFVSGACHPQATVVDACDKSETLCLPCSSDAECGFTGNNCTETVYCTHSDAQIAVVQIGCDDITTYSWPADEQCACEQGRCRYAH